MMDKKIKWGVKVLAKQPGRGCERKGHLALNRSLAVLKVNLKVNPQQLEPLTCCAESESAAMKSGSRGAQRQPVKWWTTYTSVMQVDPRLTPS